MAPAHAFQPNGNCNKPAAATLILSAEGDILWHNSSVAALVGLKELPTSGWELLNCLTQASSSVTRNTLEAFCASREELTFQLELNEKHGALLLECTVSDAPPPINAPKAAMIQLVNVSREQALQYEIEEIKADFQKFAYIASHDLQAPLQVLAGYLQLLSTPGGAEEIKLQTFLGGLDKSVKRLNSMISDLLAFSRLTTKRVQPTKFSLLAAVYSLAPTIHASFEKSFVKVSGTKDDQVFASRNQILELIKQLLDNAYQFHSKDADPCVRIVVACEETFVRMSIIDHGTGISSDNLSKVWDLFRKAHDNPNAEGNGLGLTLCKRICELNNCKIELDSTLGKGTCVTVDFPRSNNSTI